MRGKRCGVAAAVVTYRIIPAHAGQTTPIVTAWYRTPDHPRACGANTSTRSAYSTLVGSSPRMRGKLGFGSTRQCRPRIIPAHAGQTDDAVFSMLRHPDHPRACGANTPRTLEAGHTCGSSPRMRGKLQWKGESDPLHRIIPAHAGQTSGVRVDVSGTADHPRACGANRPDTPTGPPQAGSSPRMRGKRLPSVLPGLLGRIIPAHAGQTVLKAGGQSKGTDHPRACGANDSTSNATGKAHGSSPRMRGKLHRSHLRTDVPRIIPAHAGQTRPKPRTPVSPTDHPRACGANLAHAFGNLFAIGSSPRMRGKRGMQITEELRARIIPAHAGQTARPCTSSADLTDHPRACGANRHVVKRRPQSVGSSPRMRGKLLLCFRVPSLVRIIPAHAGQTPPSGLATSGTPDHPRACGANAKVASSKFGTFGSSPRMRGKPIMGACYPITRRIIPAHAGQTSSLLPLSFLSTDHPRACGANYALDMEIPSGSGSSPRMRGKLSRGHCHSHALRIIPAHAGQTNGHPTRGTHPADHPRACGANQQAAKNHTEFCGSSPRMRGKRKAPR